MGPLQRAWRQLDHLVVGFMITYGTRLLRIALAIVFMRPDLTFQSGNPLLLTVLGEFVIKNLVLIAAGLVIGSTVRQASQR